MLSWSDGLQSAGERETHEVSPYSGPSKLSSEEVECQMEALQVYYARPLGRRKRLGGSAIPSPGSPPALLVFRFWG